MGNFYSSIGRNNTGINAIEFAKKMEESGSWRIITSMDRDGTQAGYDNIELMSNRLKSKYTSYSFLGG